MSREASTSARTEEIVNNLISPNIQAEVYLEVYDNGSWQVIEDIDIERGIDWTESGKKLKFSNFALTPLPGTISFSVYNENGKYFPGSGTTSENLFDIDTKVRLKAGYILDDGSTSSESLNLNDIAGETIKSFFFGTEHSGGTVILDSDNVSGATHFAPEFLPLYDSVNYGSTTYTPDAYTVQTYDTNVIGLESFDKITVTANNTAGKIYYRTFDDPNLISTSNFTSWIYGADTIDGTQEIDFTDIDNERFIQVAVLYDGITWSSNYIISDITVYTISKFEVLYTSVYYLDNPSFTDPKAPIMPMISCKGRDTYRKAIGIDIKYSDVNGLFIDDIIKSICDKVGIAYTATSIADLSSFGARTTLTVGNTDVVKAENLLDQCMQVINTTGYVMYTEYDSDTDDNVLYVQPRPEIDDTTGVFNYLNYENIGSVAKNSGKILQRITAITDNNTTDEEVQLDVEAISSTGSKSLTWSGNAAYKRLTVDKPDDITVSNLSVNPTSISFDVDSVTGTVTVTAYGNKWSSTNPKYEGEGMNWDNMANLNGTTARLENPLFISDAECKSVSDSFVNQFGTPVFEAKNLKWPYLNLITELNDAQMMWRRFVGGSSADQIYIVTKIKHHFDKNKTPNHYTQFDLDDSGFAYSDLGDFIYDDIMDYDKGFVYDMGISTPLSTNDEIDNATTEIHNVDCA